MPNFRPNRTVEVVVSGNSSTPEYTSSADKVAANQDLLTEILIRLPVRSLMCFKSVSKHWLSLITDHFFSRRRNPDSSTVSGLFLHWSWVSSSPLIDFIPLNNAGNPTEDDAQFKALTFYPGLSRISILNSCHGLLCCFGYFENEGKYSFFILNPTTKQIKMLPRSHNHVCSNGVLSLAFDPSRSTHYEVVFLRYSLTCPTKPRYYHIEIYSSETGSWRACGEPFTTDIHKWFHAGVYWNGAINWISHEGDSLYFNVDQERRGIMPMLPVPDGFNWYHRNYFHFGESRGHLHLVEIYGLMTHFNVYEMDREYSGWFVKYHVDLDAVGAAFPEMFQMLPAEPEHHYSFAILSLLWGEKDDHDSFLVLHVPGKVIRYNLGDMTFKKIRDVPLQDSDNEGGFEGSLRYFWFHAYQYIESVTCV